MEIENRPEYEVYWRNVVAWKGAATPKVLGRVFLLTLYSLVIVSVFIDHPALDFDLGPFEVFGAGLGVLLVLRINSGYDRWWEARKLWGGIVNQSRNAVISALEYSSMGPDWKGKFTSWVIAFAHVSRRSLRGENEFSELKEFLSEEELSGLVRAPHRPSYVSLQLAHLLQTARAAEKLDSFSFLQIDRERAQLIDHLGGCERILRTPIPLVLAIKVRRLIAMFLFLVPFVLVVKVGWFTPLVMFVIAYPLFALDQIAVELQNPFSVSSLSHLPLNEITRNLQSQLKSIFDSWNAN